MEIDLKNGRRLTGATTETSSREMPVVLLDDVGNFHVRARLLVDNAGADRTAGTRFPNCHLKKFPSEVTGG